MAEPTKPAETPDWATNAGATIATPSGGKKAIGFIAEKPPFQIWNWLHYWAAKWILYFISKTDILPGANADVVLTMTAGGVITPSQGNHSVDTFAAAGTQNLVNALTANLNDGRLLILTAANAAHAVVIKDSAGGAGQFHNALGTDVTLSGTNQVMTYKRIGADWYEVCRSSNVNAGGLSRILVFSATATFTAAPGERGVMFKAWAGGGAGGGGASGSGGIFGPGGNGGNGGAGGGAGYNEGYKPLIPGTVYTANVGLGGVHGNGGAGSPANTNGNDGTDGTVGGNTWVGDPSLAAVGGGPGLKGIKGTTVPTNGANGNPGAGGVNAGTGTEFGQTGTAGVAQLGGSRAVTVGPNFSIADGGNGGSGSNGANGSNPSANALDGQDGKPGFLILYIYKG